MGFWKRLFHRHKWVKVVKAPTILEFKTPFFSRTWTEDSVAVIERCQTCGEEIAYFITYTGRKYVDPALVRSKMR